MNRRVSVTLIAAMSILSFQSGSADPVTKPIRIGILADMSGPYSSAGGPGIIAAAQMAAEDVGGKAGTRPIEIISADAQLKTDIATSISRKWIDQDGVDVIVDVPFSSGALAVSEIVKDKDRIMMTSAYTSDLSGASCNGNTLQWGANNAEVASAITNALLAQGKRKWFFITADYTFGHNLEAASFEIIRAQGGSVVGSIRLPLGVVDQSAAAIEAASSGADIVALANGGRDTINSIKQLKEFDIGSDGKAQIAVFIHHVVDIKADGLKNAQGMYVPVEFYWDMNDRTRAWTKRFQAKTNGQIPTLVHAEHYSALANYFRAMQKDPSMGGSAAIRMMRSMPTDDAVFGPETLRRNGTHRHPVYLFEVKSPAESSSEWDMLKFVSEVPASQIESAIEATGCRLSD